MLHVLYDNSGPVSGRVQALIGIGDFARLIFRRRTLADRFRGAVRDAGLRPAIELNDEADWSSLEVRLRGGEWSGDMFLLCPSRVVSTREPAAMTIFLRQAEHSPGGLVLAAGDGPDWSGWVLLDAAQLRDYIPRRAEGDLPGFFQEQAGRLVRMPDRLALVDLDDEVVLLRYLSNAFDARFFNAITQTEYLITKTSTDVTKLRREFAFYGLLPPEMQMFFVQPFDFREASDRASYRMERLHIPDTALQWLHGALDRDEFGRFLDQLFFFLRLRASRPAAKGEAEAQVEALFVDKVRERVAALKELPQYAELAPLLERGCGGVDRLLERYLALFARHRHRLPTDRLVIGHGDLCFSNILYSKTSQLMKLIDARGASGEGDLYTHPYYDIAKLSHSVLGQYDLINHDSFDIQVDEALRLKLVLDRPAPEWAAPMFAERQRAAGFDPGLVRLCEASLFVSMLPLHIDRPRKVLGFAINADAILGALEAA